MVEIHYLKPNDKIQPYAAGACAGLENFSEMDVSALVNNNNPPNYVSFDGNGIDLEDFTKKFYESGDYPGYVSPEVSDDDKVLDSEIYISLSGSVGEFSLDDGISFHFYGDCCRKIIVQYRNKYTEVFDQDEFEVNSDVFILKSDGLGDGCVGLTVRFIQTTLPNQFIKLSYIKFGTVMVFNKIKSINLLEEINVLSDDLPINSLEYTVVLENAVDFEEKDPMYLFSNKKYYGTFYLESAERVSRGVYSVKAYNSVNILENEEYAEWYAYENNTSDTFKERIRNITGINLSFPNCIYEYFGPIPIESCRRAICRFAFSVCLMADGSRSDDLKFKPIPSTVSSIITTSNKRIIGESTYTKEKYKSTAKVKNAEFFLLSSNIESVTLKYSKGKTVTYYFDEPSAYNPGSSKGFNLLEETSNYIKFTTTESEQTIEFYKVNFRYTEEKITNNLTSIKNEIDFSQFSLSGYIFDGGMQTYSFSSDKKKDILKYMQSSGTVKAKIRLRGERVGDLIKIETAYDGIKTGIITSMNISFGYEDVADIEVLEWKL